jgi:DNA polymerase-1
LPGKKKSPKAVESVLSGAAPERVVSKPNGKYREPDRIYLMDAMSFIFRAYHAMARQRGMTTKTGIPTAATYVFVNMLRKLRDDFSPQYLAAVFDVAAPTFRDQQAAAMTNVRKWDLKSQSFQEIEYGGYKANRSKMPEELAQQVPYIRRALEAYRIPILELSGYEADDVIGTLARQAVDKGRCVFVVSSDKDMLQLVNEHVCVLNPPKDNLICDGPKVEEILGVPPERVVDVMALRGDSIDNIPGAPGIGDKGSVELIRRFGSLEAALDRASEVEKKTYRESLLNNRDNILLSKQLVTIDTAVPVELDVNSMKVGEPDIDALRGLFTELEFTSLLKELLPVVEITNAKYREARNSSDVQEILSSVAWGGSLAVAIDVPTSAAPPESEDKDDPEEAMLPLMGAATPGVQNVRNVAVSALPNEALTVSLDNEGTRSAMLSALADSNLRKSVHDYKSMLRVLREQGVTLNGVQHDSMLYSYLLDPTYSSHLLPAVALRRFNLNLNGSLAEAADVTGRLASSLRREVEQAELLKVYEEIDLPLVPVLARMEHAGVEINRGVLAEMSSRLESEIQKRCREIWGLAGCEFNIGSPKQLSDVLFNKMNLPRPVKYGKGKVTSTAVDVLEGLAEQHGIARQVLEYRQLTKLKSTYIDTLPDLLNPATGRLHTTFNQTGTATGRLSSVNPNLQNIPIRTELGREIRAAFTARPGNVILAADYSQIELRLLAHFSQDELLVEAYRRGDDIHTLTASQVFGVPPLLVTSDHRRQAKVVNFGIVYGLSPFGLSQNLGIDTSEAKRFIEAYFEKYSGVRRFIDSTLEQARRDQKVKTLFGRIRPIPDINSKNFQFRGFAERTAVNTPLQGTAADLIKLAMIRIDAAIMEREMKSRMTLQVHDELVFEVPEDEVDIMKSLVREHMEQVHPLSVPLLVEMGIGPNWRDLIEEEQKEE